MVLSQRVAARISAPPFDIYRALRSVNPSPYMFFLQFEDCQLVASTPDDFRKQIENEYRVWSTVANAVGLKPE